MEGSGPPAAGTRPGKLQKLCLWGHRGEERKHRVGMLEAGEQCSSQEEEPGRSSGFQFPDPRPLVSAAEGSQVELAYRKKVIKSQGHFE